MSLRRQPYQRSSSPPPIRLTQRDKQILETIHAFDGLLSLRQIDRLFFSGQGRSQARARMRLLYDNAYVQMPDPESIHQVPMGESIYWLDRKGASFVAGLEGRPVRQFKWRATPRYAQLEHDLKVNDFHIAVEQTCRLHPMLTIDSWVSEGEFATANDKVVYTSLQGKQRKRVVRPDGYFSIMREGGAGNQQQFAFLLEIDMGSEDNPRFAREKVRPGVAYLKSAAYARRFGMRHGRYLVITSGERRLLNMKAQAERNSGKGLFYFAAFADLSNVSILTDPVWLLAGHQERRSIIPM
jgi:hypothetical protein